MGNSSISPGTHYLSSLQRGQPGWPTPLMGILHQLVNNVRGTARLTQGPSDHSLRMGSLITSDC